ncbi:hypothetical protein BAE44_0017861 [Dichanthelium oligosanthes]|uniref:Uncharacterized protein n=1 Tax=Dichanthelium oligosanthes TaxID=888268 RepID=A0A1E5V7H9_9POAL|nr:hypothetical protein BAE44_0017861 [Dichanthelium oligosanthes]
MDATHALEIASLTRQLKEELAAADAPAAQLASGCPIVIAQVGELTRNVDRADYEPHHVAIGPYHRIKTPNLAMDEDKIRSLRAVLSAASAAA